MSATPPVLDLYLRLSDLRAEDLNEAGQSKGLVEHERLLRERVAQLGAEVGECIVENDMVGNRLKSASAYRRKRVKMPDGKIRYRVIRPGFTKMLDRIESGESRGFLAVDLDRVVRDPRDMEDLIDVVSAHKANILSLTGTLKFTDGGTSDEHSMARVWTTMANKQSTDTARRVATARLRQARSGEYGGGQRPYGFASDGVTRIEAECKDIKYWAEAVLADVSLRSLARDMRERGSKTPRGFDWRGKTIRDILLRPRNMGVITHYGEVMSKAPWDPILPKEEYEAVKAKLTNPLRATSPGPAPKWLGSGVYRCICGGLMEGAFRKQFNSYRCRQYQEPGPHVVRKCDSIDRFVEDIMIERLGRPDAIDLIAKTADEKIDIAALQAQRAAVVETDKEYVHWHRNKIISTEAYLESAAASKAQLDQIDKQLAKALPVSIASKVIQSADPKAAWRSLGMAVKRAMLNEVMKVHVLVSPRGRGFHTSSVRVIWADEVTAN